MKIRQAIIELCVHINTKAMYEINMVYLYIVEAAIILDLMHGLATKIHTMDTYPQQMIMKWKFALLQLGQKSDRAGHNPGKMKALLNGGL